MKRGRTSEEKRDLELKRLAAEIPNQLVLEAMLRQIEDARHRAAVRERIRPHLRFELVDNVEMHVRLAETKPVNIVDSPLDLAAVGVPQEEPCS